MEYIIVLNVVMEAKNEAEALSLVKPITAKGRKEFGPNFREADIVDIYGVADIRYVDEEGKAVEQKWIIRER